MNDYMTDELLNFIECCIHNILYIRNIYNKDLFERRLCYQILLWQSRHPEVNIYIRRVMDNIKPLLEQGLIDRIIFTTYNELIEIDHITIKCNTYYHHNYDITNKRNNNNINSDYNISNNDTMNNNSTINNSNNNNSNNNNKDKSVIDEKEISIMHEEFRSLLLRILLLDTQPKLKSLPPDCTWQIMVVTNDESNEERVSNTVLQAALTGGEWYIDNNKLTENSKYKTSLSSLSTSNTNNNKNNYNKNNQLSPLSTSSIPSIIMNNNNATTTSNAAVVELIPIKSFRNDYINISVYAHIFNHHL